MNGRLRLGLLLFAITIPDVRGRDGWELAARHQFNAAYDEFNQGDAATDRQRQLGRAATLLNMQPRTEARLDEAQTLLMQLADTMDDAGISALYLAGRLAQSYRTPAQLAMARDCYNRLVAAQSTHPLAQAAIVQLALLELHDQAQPLAQRFSAAEKLASHLRGDFASGSYHLVLARSYLFFDAGDEAALNHLLRALSIGCRPARIRADALVSAGELARELHRPKDARRCYEQFLRENPRDPRHPTISARLQASP